MSQEKESPTIVIYRKWRGKPKTVIALFPEICESFSNPDICGSYEHIGQYGGASHWHIMRVTVPAKPEEYADLHKELESLGYNLVIRQRESPKMRETRFAEWQRYQDMQKAADEDSQHAKH